MLDYEGEAPRILSNIQFGEGAGQAIKKREKSVVFVPVAAIIAREVIKRAIMAGTNVALNVIIEVAIEKYFGHGNYCSWLDALKSVNICIFAPTT